ncbi:MAG: CoA-disulfide reductase [Bacillota bacterium]
MRVIVIGGVAAGMSAASKIKRTDKSVEVIVYEKGMHLSYGACGLPYFVSNVNDDWKRMIARTKEDFEAQGIMVRTQHEVVKVIPSDKKLIIRNLLTGDLLIDYYDKLMVACGASPIIPDIPGTWLKGLYVLKTIEDAVMLKEAAQRESVKNVVIVGGGYIGIEVVEAMAELNKNVRCIEASSRILAPFDSEISDIAAKEISRHGIRLHTSEKVEAILGQDHVEAVKTDKGTYKADLVVMAIGVRPATQFLRDAGIRMSGNGAIIVDRELRTNISGIWAAGDCAEVYHRGMEENVFLPLGTVANKCGRIAGGNILGRHDKFIGALGSAAIKVLGLELGRTGMSENNAKHLGYDYSTVLVTANDHPSYYPNPTPITIKLIYEKGSKRILGAQAAGEKGAVLRIDVLAVAIHNRMTTEELGMADLCYAPPFAGVWDAVHIACNAAR